MTSALIPREEYAALERCVYLNQASLGLVPRRSTKSMVDFLVDVAQYGNVRLSDATRSGFWMTFACLRPRCLRRRCGRWRW